jgi:hypothetical protein
VVVVQITLVGKLVSMHELATNLSMVLDDGTGRVDIKYWIDNDETDLVRVHNLIATACFLQLAAR